MTLTIWLCVYFFFISSALTWLAMPASGVLGAKFGMMDHPGDRKVHGNPIPLTGGLILFGVFGLVLFAHGLVVMSMDVKSMGGVSPGLAAFSRGLPGVWERLAWMLIAALSIFGLGLADDRFGLRVRTRLLLQFGAATLSVCGGVQPAFEGVPVLIGWIICIFWVVTIINAFNMVDGLDGLAGGLGLIASLLMAASLLMTSQSQGAIVLACLSGCLVGFLRFNAHPAKVFMGNSGAMTLGLVLGSMTLYL